MAFGLLDFEVGVREAEAFFGYSAKEEERSGSDSRY